MENFFTKPSLKAVIALYYACLLWLAHNHRQPIFRKMGGLGLAYLLEDYGEHSGIVVPQADMTPKRQRSQ